jgi:molybdopterin-binding protein
MKLSARNQIEGEVIHVEKDNVAAIVKIMIDQPGVITAMITAESVDSLDIKVGDRASAVFKSSEVMISKE